MMDILDRLKAGRELLGPATLNGVPLGLRVLTEQDYQKATFAATALFDENGVDLGLATADTFESEKTIQLLTIAVVDPETGKPVFPDAETARATLMRHDKNALAEAYLEHERKFSPSGSNLSQEDFDALVEEVKKNPSTPRLNDLSGEWLRKLVTTLASQPSS